MSDRPLIRANPDKPIINAVSMVSNITGPATNMYGPTILGYDISWTGTPIGTFAVQVSNTYTQDNLGNVINAGNWSTIPTTAFSGTYPVPAGSAGNGFLDIVGTGATWCRLVYTAGSSTGNLTVVVSGKVT